ncbi:MAG: holo-ACP synthase [Acidimicrobiia bacterium]|nr:holo-ACP synthase [Acidimicrobiia bacterium]
MAAIGRPVLSVGVDLVDVARIKAAIDRTAGFTRRVFTDGERARAEQGGRPEQRYAVRWAAKEATLKALGVGLGAAAFTDIEVTNDPSGRPHLTLAGRAATLAAAQGVDGWLVSLTHTDHLAQATVVALAAPAGPAVGPGVGRVGASVGEQPS